MEQIQFETLEKEILNVFKKQDIWVFATAAGNRVTARPVTILNEGLTVLFQTDGKSEKAAQIRENPNVALCRDNIQYEGVAEIFGGYGDEKSAAFYDRYQLAQPNSFRLYAGIPEQIVVSVQPKRIKVWKYVGGIPYIDYLDPVEKKAWRELQDYRK